VAVSGRRFTCWASGARPRCECSANNTPSHHTTHNRVIMDTLKGLGLHQEL
ncbi:unnamed protein product, partial [Vitrella brassicaformis CCMP3155]